MRAVRTDFLTPLPAGGRPSAINKKIIDQSDAVQYAVSGRLLLLKADS
jgi:hypothetical protein